jgi:putative iron-dependent peroxidase
VLAQPGIFALGIPEHCYIELDLRPSVDAVQLVTRLAGLSGAETTIAGVSVVVGVRPELWAVIDPRDSPPDVSSFREVEGPEITFPATQHDAWFWIAGGARDVVLDSALRVLDELRDVAVAASETTGWLYQHKRDLTGFIDGTENPPMLEAPGVAAATTGPGAGSSVLLYQKWKHFDSWRALTDEEQELVIGRTKPDSIELDEEQMPPDSHVSRNVIEEDGEELKIYRRNTAYGGPTDHGTVFVGFCATQRPLQVMLERMAGVGDGIRDALTRYSTPLSGAYYVVPSVEALQRLLTAPAD